mmetsp:Transcript_23305/g.69533  ORF Transcript_23305/g.69533 Transcript_23305/m.69533 type:complete len:395 (+) Transcript_23305:525-1709(+)
MWRPRAGSAAPPACPSSPARGPRVWWCARLVAVTLRRAPHRRRGAWLALGDGTGAAAPRLVARRRPRHPEQPQDARRDDAGCNASHLRRLPAAARCRPSGTRAGAEQQPIVLAAGLPRRRAVAVCGRGRAQGHGRRHSVGAASALPPLAAARRACLRAARGGRGRRRGGDGPAARGCAVRRRRVGVRHRRGAHRAARCVLRAARAAALDLRLQLGHHAGRCRPARRGGSATTTPHSPAARRSTPPSPLPQTAPQGAARRHCRRRRRALRRRRRRRSLSPGGLGLRSGTSGTGAGVAALACRRRRRPGFDAPRSLLRTVGAGRRARGGGAIERRASLLLPPRHPRLLPGRAHHSGGAAAHSRAQGGRRRRLRLQRRLACAALCCGGMKTPEDICS